VDSSNDELRKLAIAVVAENQPLKPSLLVEVLRQRGASLLAANETLFTMLRDGHLSRTWNGKLELPY
jgi:hypothetical protein